MRELSVFVDESGNGRRDSKYYLLTLVFHDQDVPITGLVDAYEAKLRASGMADVPLHLNPLIRANDEYADLGAEERRRMLGAFRGFANRCPFTYLTFAYKKSHFSDDEALYSKMRQDLVNALFERLEVLQGFDTVKIYYDNGQGPITQVLHSAFEYALGRQAVVYRDCAPNGYRLQQVADYACGIELAALKYESRETGRTEEIFYGTWREFNKSFLKKLRSKRLM